MKSFKEYLRNITEDKVLTKEDEGAVTTAGDISSPTSTPSGDVQASSSKPQGSVSYDEIIGHCDHKKDGFMGKGCMHRPYNVFSYPISRINKKKRKYIKVIDLTESDEFNVFKSRFEGIIDQEIESANDYISKLGITCHYEKDYDFSDEKTEWVGAVDFDNQYNVNDFGIALNLPVIYGFLEENGLESDETELKCQIRSTLYHELGHIIVQKLKDDETYDFELDINDEENLVEEFSNYMMREYTGKTSSKLHTFIDEIFN